MASSVVGLVPARLPAIRLPTETRCVPMRPVNGAVMRVWSRSNWASRTAAFGVVDGRLGGALLGGLLVGVLDAAGAGLLQRVGADELAVGEVEAGTGRFRAGPTASLSLIW